VPGLPPNRTLKFKEREKNLLKKVSTFHPGGEDFGMRYQVHSYASEWNSEVLEKKAAMPTWPLS
jgi:hypothetical protein